MSTNTEQEKQQNKCKLCIEVNAAKHSMFEVRGFLLVSRASLPLSLLLKTSEYAGSNYSLIEKNRVLGVFRICTQQPCLH